MAVDRCYICASDSYSLRPGRVRDLPDLEVRECAGCGLVYLSSRRHVTDAFYQESGMVSGDVDLDRRVKEAAWDDERRYRFLEPKLRNRDVLDFGAGIGGFAERAAAAARSVDAIELEQAVAPRFERLGVELFPDLAAVEAKRGPRAYDLVTAFHVIEHLPDPARTLREMAGLLRKGGEILVEVPHADDALLTLYESEAFSHFTYWSCHLYLFTAETLRRLGDKAGLRTRFVKQVQRYPLSNHLLWLAKGRPGGHQTWSFLDSGELHAAYEKQLATVGKCDTLIAAFAADRSM